MSSSLSPGTILGHYEILAHLGTGGMGEVYLAQDSKLDRKVALKVLPVQDASNQKNLRRFVLEAKATSALNHPNIVTIYDIEETRSTRLIATEFIDGETLRHQMNHSQLSINRIIEVCIQISDALAAAHEAGIIHRDIKPENIMLRRRDGYVKVLDFGLAKLTESENEHVVSEAPTKMQVVTDPGVVLGTVQYMSPEQARGLTLDARTDIFSLGVLIYEMIAGCAPFRGDTKADVLSSILEKEPPPLARYSTKVPETLEWIVGKALRKTREERYQTARELLTDLRSLKQRLDFSSELERSVSPESATEKTAAFTSTPISPDTVSNREVYPTTSAEYLLREVKRHKVATVGVAALIVIGVALGIRYWRSQPHANAALPFSKIKLTRLTTTGKAGAPAISPDGKYVAHVMGERGDQSLWLRHIESGSDKEITPSVGTSYCCPVFTPDGGYIYYGKSQLNTPNIMYQVPVLGGPTKMIVEDIDSRVTLSPDGKRVAFIRGYPTQGVAALMLLNADGSDEKKLATFDVVDFFPPANTMYPSWSPNGEVIIVSVPVVDAAGSYRQILAIGEKDGSSLPIGFKRWSSLGQFQWLSDGSGLIFTASDEAPGSPQQIWYLSYPAGEARKITNDLNDYVNVTLTADSRALATLQRDSTTSVWLVPVKDEQHAVQVTSNKYDGSSGISFVSDGRVIYTSRSGANVSLWITDSGRASAKQLTTDPSNHFNPAVSPDGRYVVFSSDRSGPGHIWRIGIDGSDLKQLTNGKLDQYPNFSPDGQWVVYTANENGKQTLRQVSIEGGNAVQVGNIIAASASFSPDGKFLLCAHIEERKKPLRWVEAIIPVGGGEPIKTFENLPAQRPRLNIRWSPSGKELTYIVTRGGVSNVWSQPVDGGPPKQLTDFKTGVILFYDWSRDGKQLALTRLSVSNDVVLISDIN